MENQICPNKSSVLLSAGWVGGGGVTGPVPAVIGETQIVI